MLYETQLPSKFDMTSTTLKIPHKANLANADTTRLKADNETAYAGFGLLDLEKKKEQFLTIDRF